MFPSSLQRKNYASTGIYCEQSTISFKKKRSGTEKILFLYKKTSPDGEVSYICASKAIISLYSAKESGK